MASSEQVNFMNLSTQINSNPWLNFSMIGMMWLFNALCAVYCITTAVVLMKMLLAVAA